MARSVQALVKPELLVWAREAAGYSIGEAAAKLSFNEDRLIRIENGEGTLTFNQLISAANLYKRPVAAFFLPEAPDKRPLPIHDFRLRQGIELMKYSPPLGFAIRSAQGHRDDLIDLAFEVGDEIKKFELTASLREAPRVVAARIRAVLGITVEVQQRWRSNEDALKFWKSAVEALGVLVFEVSRIPLSEMRGFSIPADELPVIVINGGDAHTARIFTLFHEFTHLLLRDGGVCDLYPSEETKSAAARLEIFCNAVAAEFLIPENTFRKLLPAQRSLEWASADISAFAVLFSVSREVVLRRLLTMGRTSQDFYAAKRLEYQREFEEMKAKAKAKKSGGPNPAVMAVRNLGRPYVTTVLEAYAQNKISLSSVSGYLGVKTRHLNRIGELVGRKMA